ncbi:hypothetical protein EST38_g14110 [Candolleomyces aberdarensis]|uniref:Ribosome biogenesis protein NOP53 n=1 Tax=Candolleomyces aberdarensis TaxID=2316362 RepID=A0A4Q2D0U7_9AGAR|nr:hypothetical protein EST38_g14110 [Candolleomyces aberdarensis]
MSAGNAIVQIIPEIDKEEPPILTTPTELLSEIPRPGAWERWRDPAWKKYALKMDTRFDEILSYHVKLVHAVPTTEELRKDIDKIVKNVNISMAKSSKTTISKPTAATTGAGGAKKAVAIAKSTKSSIGAPSQHSQSSRKGKKAWRKNVNIEDVEGGLEEMRSEERVVGTALQNLKDGDLFEIDVKGDDKIRHILPKFSSSQLTSTKILAQRSAVPAVFSRTTSSSSSKRKAANLSQEEKERLIRIAKRPRKGPFNGVMDPSELKSGEGIVELSEAVKQSGKYDPWADADGDVEMEEVKDGLETVQPKKVKPPQTTTKPSDMIDIPAVVEPHQGTSYNPPVDAHLELIRKAHEVEERRVLEAEKLAETKKKMEAARIDVDDGADGAVPAGMKIDTTADDWEEEEEEKDDQGVVRKQPKPKSKAQKNKAAKLLAEKRALAELAARKRQMGTIDQAKSLRKANAKQNSEQQLVATQRRMALQLKLKQAGLSGQRLGKHKVPEAEVEVQLGEDLSENLRGLKPEGNLFRDRFHSLQQRALVEPRVRVLPKKRTHKIVEYEKHAWKKFE